MILTLFLLTFSIKVDTEVPNLSARFFNTSYVVGYEKFIDNCHKIIL